MLPKSALIIIILVGCGMLYAISLCVGVEVYNANIDNTYPQYNLAGQGKLIEEMDCVGNTVLSIGEYTILNNVRVSSSYRKWNAQEYLRGGDCEYKLYKGWHWGIWDFYYIAPK